MASLIRFHYDPFAEFNHLLDDAFNARLSPSAEVCQRARSQGPVSFRPRLDLHESKDSNTVTATFELPGLTSKDVTIEVHHDRLVVSGVSVVSDAREEDGYAIRKRRRGKFSRTLQLPFGTKPEDVKAKLEDGLLTVTFPREAPEQQPQGISIQ